MGSSQTEAFECFVACEIGEGEDVDGCAGLSDLFELIVDGCDLGVAI